MLRCIQKAILQRQRASDSPLLVYLQHRCSSDLSHISVPTLDLSHRFRDLTHACNTFFQRPQFTRLENFQNIHAVAFLKRSRTHLLTLENPNSISGTQRLLQQWTTSAQLTMFPAPSQKRVLLCRKSESVQLLSLRSLSPPLLSRPLNASASIQMQDPDPSSF